MIEARTVDVGGRRVVHIGTYTLAFADGDPPELRVFIATGWVSQPPLPLGPDTVDVPASALPAILAALEALT